MNIQSYRDSVDRLGFRVSRETHTELEGNTQIKRLKNRLRRKKVRNIRLRRKRLRDVESPEIDSEIKRLGGDSEV